MGDGLGAMPDVVLFDGRIIPAAQAVVPVADRAVLYGESLFETIKVVDGAPCLWREHVARLAAGCDELGLPLDLGALARGVRELLGERAVAHGVLRVQVTGGVQPGGGRGLTAPAAGRRPHVIATVASLSPVAPDVYASGVAVVSDGRWARGLPHLKSSNYLASVAAKQRAEAAGAYECLLTVGDPPEVLEGATSNMLVWDGSALVSTPAAGRLAGVTLAVVTAAAGAAGIPVREERVPLESLRGNGLLLTGSLLGVCFCVSVDGHRLLPAGHLTGTLRHALYEREAESRERWFAGGEAAR
jgi:branched-subunit amino acid aminotransferase/4-amino-4-deoxychorismate lyase